MGDLRFREEKTKQCCSVCHYLSVYDVYPDQRRRLHRTWNETERTELKVKVGDGTCAKGEWSQKEIWNLINGDSNLITKDRSECPSFEKYRRENRYVDLELYLESKKGKTDRNRFRVLASIGLVGIAIGILGLCRSGGF